MKQAAKILLYTNFINDLSDGLIKELGDTYETRAIANTRNNGVTKRGILIRHQEETIAPAIYLEDYYQKYCDGMCLSDIIRQVLYTYKEGVKENEDPKLDQFELSPKAIQEKLIFRIVNYAKNAEALDDTPHIRFLNLVVTFQILVYQKEDGIGTIHFTSKHYDTLADVIDNLSLEKLYQLALTNTMRLFPPKLNSIEEVLESFSLNKTTEQLPLEQAVHANGNLYVLTNQDGINGAGCLMYPGLIEKLEEYFQSKYYILPSSIHEVLLLPVRHSVEPEELNDMIREINLTQVPEEEILSDCCYFSSNVQETIQKLFSKD